MNTRHLFHRPPTAVYSERNTAAMGSSMIGGVLWKPCRPRKHKGSHHPNLAVCFAIVLRYLPQFGCCVQATRSLFMQVQTQSRATKNPKLILSLTLTLSARSPAVPPCLRQRSLAAPTSSAKFKFAPYQRILCMCELCSCSGWGPTHHTVQRYVGKGHQSKRKLMCLQPASTLKSSQGQHTHGYTHTHTPTN